MKYTDFVFTNINYPKWIILAIFLLLIIVPYITGFINSGNDMFNGFLFNPVDGNSYLAKMYQGFEGSWEFKLLYSSEPGEGAFLFVFYLFLGHVSRLLSIPLVIMFHVARIICGVILFFTVDALVERIKTPETRTNLMLAVILFGSGLGWLLIPFEYQATDFWVAEAYPFLSVYSNPHFPLAISLIILIILNCSERSTTRNYLLIGILGIFLSVILPFGLIQICVIIGIWTFLKYFTIKKLYISPIISLLPGVLLAGYQYIQTVQHPALSIWNQQNITLSPPLWDVAISFSPMILFVIYFGVKKYQESKWGELNDIELMMWIWLLMTIILIYLPYSLQRRFLTGFYVPVGVLGIIGLSLIQKRVRKLSLSKMVFPVTLSFVFITNLLLFSMGFFHALQKTDKFFISANEIELLDWIRSNSDDGDVFLAEESFSRVIPAYTGRNVVYGHFYETINAEREQEFVEAFYNFESSAIEQFEDKRIDFVILETQFIENVPAELESQLVIVNEIKDEFVVFAKK